MASLRRVKPLPIPGAELARLKETLHPEYGSALHEAPAAEGEGTERILIVRVPRDDPDMVNDIEQAVEYLHPGELQDATSCLLVGNVRTLQFPTQPLKDLMAARIQFDRRQCHLLRGQLKPGEHRLFKAPEDPRRLVRLALRLERAKVADIDESDLVAAAHELGPKLATPQYKEVRSVYLIANGDDVRMDADLFYQDLQARWGEESERRRLASEIVQKEAALRIQEEAARQKALASRPASLPVSTPHRVAVAPLRQPASAAVWESESMKADPARAAMYAHLDALMGIPTRPLPTYAGPTSTPTVGTGSSIPSDPRPPAGLPHSPLGSDTRSPTPAASPAANPAGAASPLQAPSAIAPPLPIAPPAALPQHLAELKARLEASGFDVLVRPAGLVGIDLAAERAAAFPHRLLAYCPDRLDVALADTVLATAKQMQVDLALVVCAEAATEARKRFIATRARWVDPAGLAELQL